MSEEEVYAGKYDDLVAVITNACYVIATIQDVNTDFYDEAKVDAIRLTVHSFKVIKKCQEAILKDLNT